MANGIDRLERLFTKKKHAATRVPAEAGRPSSLPYTPSLFPLRKGPSATTSTSPRSSAPQDVHFPSPSFIRPKTTRMVPREDTTRVSSPPPRPSTAGRSQSLSDPASNSAGFHSIRGLVSPPRNGAGRGASAGMAPRHDYLGVKRSKTTTHKRYSYIEIPYQLGDPVPGALPDTSYSSESSNSSSSSLGNAHLQRLPKRSSSLLQRRDLTIAPLSSFSTYQPPRSRNSAAITISSGEVSPATIPQTTMPAVPSLPKADHTALHLQLDQLQGLSDAQDMHPLFLQQPLQEAVAPLPLVLGGRTSREETKQSQSQAALAHVAAAAEPFAPSATAAQLDVDVPVELATVNDDELSASQAEKIAEPANMNTATFTETPLLQRDSVFSIVLPQKDTSSRESRSLPSSPRRRSRVVRRPMSMRYQRHLPAQALPSSPNSVLMEPKLGEFLSLSDDDIAEAVPAAGVAAPAAKDEGGAGETRTIPAAAPVATKEPETEKKLPPELQKPLPPVPLALSGSPPASPASTKRRPTLQREDTPPSRPPSFQAPPPPPPPPPVLELLPALPVPPMALSVARPRTSAGQARMAAAFEIARIASQYKFDLAYIASICIKNATWSQLPCSPPPVPDWPLSPVSPTSSSKHSLSRTNSQASRISRASRTSRVSTNSKATTTAAGGSHRGSSGSAAPMIAHSSGLEAHFLAAYGLATVQAPYNLSASTHAQILNAGRWLTLTEPGAKPAEFARGYGCVLQRSSLEQEQGRLSIDAASSSAPSTSNRGIVFVAYRRGEAEATADDLAALHRDVSALVDKIFDAHVQQHHSCLLVQPEVPRFTSAQAA